MRDCVDALVHGNTHFKSSTYYYYFNLFLKKVSFLLGHIIFEHMRRLPDCTPAHMVLKLAVTTRSGDTPYHDWNRPAGRPLTTWMSQIVPDTGLTAVDARAVAEDWLTWRALRPTAGYAQQ